MGKEITILMLKQHNFLNGLLKKYEALEAKNRNLSKIKDYFYNFKWNLDKHFFIEEKDIFVVTDLNDKKEFELMKSLLKDHEDLRETAKKMAEEILEGHKPSSFVLSNILLGHEKREVKIFYPKLDSRLPAKEKKDIIEKSRDIKII